MIEHYGHYVYGGKTYQTKLDVLYDALHRADLEPDIRLYFNDDVFDQIDWTVEPEPSLTDLYVRRARQLREKYDYLILMYSGGSDSHQALCSFLRAGAYLDEVRSVYPLKMLERVSVEPDPSHPLGLLFEYQLAAVPGLSRVARESPRTKIVVSDYTDFALDNYTEEWLGDNERHHPLTSGLFMTLKMAYDAEDLTRYTERLGRGRVGVVYGAEKPRLELDGDSAYAVFVDANRTGVVSTTLYPGARYFVPEMFFWSRDLPEIPVKQAHAVLRRLRADPAYRDLMRRDFDAADVVTRDVVYPDWDSRTYQRASKRGNDAIIEQLFPERSAGALLAHKNDYYLEKFKRVTGEVHVGGSRYMSVTRSKRRYVGEATCTSS